MIPNLRSLRLNLWYYIWVQITPIITQRENNITLKLNQTIYLESENKYKLNQIHIDNYNKECEEGKLDKYIYIIMCRLSILHLRENKNINFIHFLSTLYDYDFIY